MASRRSLASHKAKHGRSSCMRDVQLKAAREGWGTTIRMLVLQMASRVWSLLALIVLVLVAPHIGVGTSVLNAVFAAIQHGMGSSATGGPVRSSDGQGQGLSKTYPAPGVVGRCNDTLARSAEWCIAPNRLPAGCQGNQSQREVASQAAGQPLGGPASTRSHLSRNSGSLPMG